MDDKKKKSLFPSAKELEAQQKSKINKNLLVIRKVSMSRWQLVDIKVENAEVVSQTVLKDDLPAIVLGHFERKIREADFDPINN